MDIRDIFISEEEPYSGKSKRDKFLSRDFGIFNEEIIRIWCKNTNSPFNDLGRPTVYDADGRHYTLDFLLENDKGERFVGEMKCEIEYQKYQYFTLGAPSQLEHHRNKRAFQVWLDIATQPDRYTVRCKGVDTAVNGSALIWGRVLPDREQSVKDKYSISHILSAEALIADLLTWGDENYSCLISSHSDWMSELFTGLKGS